MDRGLRERTLGFGGEESAGACFLRRNGRVWTTDEDGIVSALLSAEITARTGRDPSERYSELVRVLGEPLHPLPSASYDGWLSTYQWKQYYGQQYVYAGPLFTHQLSHIWTPRATGRWRRGSSFRRSRSPRRSGCRQSTISCATWV